MHRPLLVLLALAVALPGCGWDRSSQGVHAVAGRALEPAERAEVVTELAEPEAELGPPSAGGAGNGAAGDPDTAGEATPTTTEVAVPADTPDTVAVVGDSLTRSAAEEIEAALQAIGVETVAIDAVESRRMVSGSSSLPPGIDAIDDLVAVGLEPDVWVVALGTNDIASDPSLATFGDDVASVVRHIPANDPIIWVDVWIRNEQVAVVEANQRLRSILSVRPHSAVVDWYPHGHQDGVILEDGVHLTGRGQLLFAAAIRDAVDEMFPG